MAGLLSHSLPVKVNQEFWFCLSFLGLWMEKAIALGSVESRLPALWRGKQELTGGTNLSFY